MRVSSPCASQRDVCTQYRHQGRIQLFIQAKAFRDRGVGERQKGELGVGGWVSETRGIGLETDRVGGEVYTRL